MGAALFEGEPAYLVASITKPVVAMAILSLVEAGELLLNDRVTRFLPDFGREQKHGTEIRHLLTHTSGLPDLPTNNTELRKAHAGLEAFVEVACESLLAFAPGRGVQYQSLGYAVLGAIIEKVTGMPQGEYIRQTIFDPLGMSESTLGPGTETAIRRVERRQIPVQVPEDQVGGENWNWNSTWWRTLGAPWGGMVATPSDLVKFLRAFAKFAQFGHEGTGSTQSFLSRTSMARSLENQLVSLPELGEIERRTRGWGYGWRLNWRQHASPLCELLPETTCGHWGATGTLCWLDPQSGTYALILTSQPADRSRRMICRLSNLLALAVAG
jgi:CubicO group peptidase (beta-lactamase class C family)